MIYIIINSSSRSTTFGEGFEANSSNQKEKQDNYILKILFKKINRRY